MDARLRRQRGSTLIETMIALAVLALSALSLTSSWSMSTRAARGSDQSLAAQAALLAVYESVADVAWDQLLAWDQVTVDRGDHRVLVQANVVAVGVIQLDFTVTERATGTVVARIDTLRSGEL